MEWAADLATKLSSAPNGGKAAVIASYAALTGKSPATLYRIARQHGWDSGRKARRDRGALRCGLTDEQVATVSSLLQVTGRENKGPILPVTEALAIAADSGLIEPGAVSAGRLAAILRDRAMGAKALREATPHIRMASRFANHVHVFDGSVCIQYYLKGGGVAVMDERDFNDKKPRNCAKVKQRLLRMMLTDHFSHFMFVKYYAADGESQVVIFDFLASAWTGGLHEKLPFRGLPKFVLMDAGSANIAKSMLNMLHELGIGTPKSLPHNPRRQGSAECAHRIWEEHFEARLRLEPADNIEKLNLLTLDYLVRWNTTRVHRRHGMTRAACWLKHVRGHLIDCPARELLQEAFALPALPRTVRGDYTITYESNEYRIKHVEGIRPGMKVLVKKRPVLWPQLVVIHDQVEYTVTPIGTMEGGFRADAQVIGEGYKAQPETAVQKARKENERLAYGEEKEKDAVPFGGTLQVFGHHADTVGAVPMPVRGTPMQVKHDLAAREIPVMELFKRLRDAGVAMTVGLNAELRAALGDSVPVAAAERIVAALAEGGDWREPGSSAAVAAG